MSENLFNDGPLREFDDNWLVYRVENNAWVLKQIAPKEISEQSLRKLWASNGEIIRLYNVLVTQIIETVGSVSNDTLSNDVLEG